MQTDSDVRLESQCKVRFDCSHPALKLNRRTFLLQTAQSCKLRSAKHYWVLNNQMANYWEGDQVVVTVIQ